MARSPTFEVDSWETALTIVRYLVPDAEVTVPKESEPLLPTEVSLRRSNVPWSIHKGARRVYREDRRGEHVQIREYADHWTVELDNNNPHYRPMRHVALDTPEYTRRAAAHPISTTTDVLFFGPLRTAQLAQQITVDSVSTLTSMFDRSLDVLIWPLELTDGAGDKDGAGGADSDTEPCDEDAQSEH